MDTPERIATMIKLEQLALFAQRRRLSYPAASALFDQCRVWSFIDDAFEGFHVQGPRATYRDIAAHIQRGLQSLRGGL
jgi:hypothetical protein